MSSSEDSHAFAPRGYRAWAIVPLCFLFACFAHISPLRADTGYKGWLRYGRVDEKTAKEHYAKLPAVAVALGDSEVVVSARDEMIRGLKPMLGQTLRVETKLPNENAIVLAQYGDAQKAIPSLKDLPKLAADGFWLKALESDGHKYLLITAPNDRGVLYGAFALLRKITLGQPIAELNERHAPAASLRMIEHWDHLDGSVDRNGKSSLFWDDDHATKDLDRVRDYARLLSSIGVNAISINDPAAGQRLIEPEARKELAKLNDVLRRWGTRLFIAINFTNPPAIQSNDSATWDKYVADIYKDVPGLGGFVLDADWDTGGEPAEANAERAKAINTIAAALRPHNGIVICRTCVCGHPVDRDEQKQPAYDQAKIAYELFQPLDGQLDENVVLQIKHGPMNFQVREPPSPLLGSLEKSNRTIEFQITQEHLGQQRHLCFLVPMWKQVLEFNMQAKEQPTPVKELVTGKTFARPLGGFVAVSNARRGDKWLGNDLAMANLYGFGRLAWDPNLTPKAIADEWTHLTFGHDSLVVGTLVDMLLKSWRIYENYTGPLGAGTLTDVENHFGPGIESTKDNGWAPWHTANETGIGKDRTSASGTGFIAQYRPPVAQRFESLESCPDELLLFMHHVPYTHTLKSSKTVIQHIYDVHYDGARDAARLARQWTTLAGHVDEQRYQAVLKQLVFQAGHAQLWRDAVCNWFLYKSGIADSEGRVGNYPNRFEAEAMKREGYEPKNVSPWETASGGQCAECVDPEGKGVVSLKYEGKAGWHDLFVRYFDESDGASKYRLLVSGQEVDKWTADDTLPDDQPNGHTSTRHESRRVALRPGDEIRIEATADADERAAIDYLEIEPAAK